MTIRGRAASPEETEAWGAAIAHACPAPATIGLVGGLGAGKTCFVRGFVRALAPELVDWVCSPTYALCNEYPHAPPIRHLDLYRLADADDLEGIGYRDMVDGWRIVEWIDHIDEAEEGADLVVFLDVDRALDESARRVRVEARSARGERAISALEPPRG